MLIVHKVKSIILIDKREKLVFYPEEYKSPKMLRK